jgi:4-hydroxy-2-oxoheptanedioate aldolase
MMTAGRSPVGSHPASQRESRPVRPVPGMEEGIVSFVNPLLERWASGGVVYSGWVSTGEPLIASFLAGCGFDEVLVDLQHGAVEMGDLPRAFAAIEARGVAPAARVPVNDAMLIGRALDLGALSVMVPMVETPGEAAAAVAACRFPPLGRRSMGPIRAMTTMGSDRPSDLNQVACIVQVETALGLRNVDQIAATPGLTGIFIGPSDLALSLGLDETDPAVQPQRAEAHAAILAATKRHGIVAGIITGNGTQAAAHVEQGFRLVALTADITLIAEGGARELAAARAATLP